MGRSRGQRNRAAGLAVVVAAVVGSLLAAAPAIAAVPTCTPGTPSVVGSAADGLTVTLPGCSTEAGLTGYRLFVLTTADAPVDQLDVGIGTTQTEVTGLQPGTLYRFRLAARNGDGTGPTGAPSAAASPPFTTLASMVDRQ